MLKISRHFSRLFGAALVATALASGANAADVAVKHAQGETTVATNPEKSSCSISQRSTILIALA